MHFRSRPLSFGLALVLAVLLSACGGGGDDPGVAGTGQETARGGPVPAIPTGLTVSYSLRAFHFSWLPVAGSTHYQLREDADGTGPGGYQLVPGVIWNSSFVHRLQALHLRLNARYVVRACNLAGCSADSAPLTPYLVHAVGYFKASNPDGGDGFGGSLALSADGQTLAVGAVGEDSNAPGINANQLNNSADFAGAVYVFRRVNGEWVQQAYVKASNPETGDYFGYSVALSADGNTLAVGAPLENSAAQAINGDQADNSAQDAGAVYVFGRVAGWGGELWSQQAYIKASNADAGDQFGTVVGLSHSGDVLAVGAPWEAGGSANGDPNDNSLEGAGAAYMFRRAAGVWTQQAYIKASNLGFHDQFGLTLALSGDGMTLAVAAPAEESNAPGIGGNEADNSLEGAGAVYVYTIAPGFWSQQAYVKASNPGAGDTFGFSVALSADGNTLAVGAVGEASNATGIGGTQGNGAPDAGAVYVFARSPLGWAQQAYVKASNTDTGDRFGISVALSADGNMLAVGADGEDSLASGMNGNQFLDWGNNGGAAYVFARDAGIWTQRSYVKPRATGVNDSFGRYLALSADGLTLVVATVAEDGGDAGIGGDPFSNSLQNAGAVFFY